MSPRWNWKRWTARELADLVLSTPGGRKDYEEFALLLARARAGEVKSFRNHSDEENAMAYVVDQAIFRKFGVNAIEQPNDAADLLGEVGTYKIRRAAARLLIVKTKERRQNPPVSRAPYSIQKIARRVDVDDPKHPKGCGVFGCVYKTKDPRFVRKVTLDQSEVEMVREVMRLRGKPVPHLSDRDRRLLSTVGCVPEEARHLGGIVAFKGSIEKVGRGWSYLKESVRPLDHARSRRDVHDADDAIEDLIYARHPDYVRLLMRWPKMRLIVQTHLYLRLAHGLRLEDVHGEQVGVVTKTSALHRRGDWVLYDGQID